MDKTVDAALEQRRAIQILRDRGALETLSPKLREAAQLREAHPELSLAQLAALCRAPCDQVLSEPPAAEAHPAQRQDIRPLSPL